MYKSLVRISIAARLALWIVLTTGSALGAYATWLVAAERDELLAVAEQQMRVLGGSAQVAFENALRDEQGVDVKEFVERVEALDDVTDVVVVDEAGVVLVASAQDAVVSADVVALARLTAQDRRERWRGGDERVAALVLALPLVDEGQTFGALLVIRRLDDIRLDLARTRRGVASVVLAALLLIVGVTVGGTVYFVRRPLTETRLAMREVRYGNLKASVSTARRDEITEIIDEFNALVRALQATRDRLEEEAAARRQLESSLARAEKLVTVAQLAAGLAHEIGTPLHVVAGRARSVLERPGDAAHAERVARIVVEQTERIARIVDQLLRYARLTPPRAELIDVSAPVLAIVELLEGEARRADVTLRFQTSPAPRVRGNGDELQQVALNLVRNARVATPAGGRIDVTVEGVAADARWPAGAVRLTVADTGCGIDKGALERVFEPFFTTRTDGGGTGLGLAVVKTIVSDHRGVIDIASTPGVGTTVTVVLPAADDAPARATPETT